MLSALRRINLLMLSALIAFASAHAQPALAADTTSCPGDCNRDGVVTINELIVGVNIALGSAQLTQCPSFDRNSDGEVAINELILGVNAALGSCVG